jgi:hypothetical protein
VFEEAVKKLPDPQMMPNNALWRNLDSEWSESMCRRCLTLSQFTLTLSR